MQTFRIYLIFIFLHFSQEILAQNPLFIPDSLIGPIFNLNVQNGTQVFYGSTSTPTFGINGPSMCPTLIANKGDSITLNVTNNLAVTTTMHWHGFHVSAMNDGGPHQVISSGNTWSPSFKVRNNAATFWYHPHGEGQTEQQISKGLAGLFIIRDSSEVALNLPRTYGVDDFPLIVQTKSFDVLQQIAIATNMDTAVFINGTVDPVITIPAQVVRFRLLDASSLRSFNFGFSNNQVFSQIASDGGLFDSVYTTNRILLSTGERAEILIDFSGMMGQTVYLRNYGTEIPNGIYGADSVGFGNDTLLDYHTNFLNGADFNLLKIVVGTPTTGAISSIPSSLVPNNPYNPVNASTFRTIEMDTIRLLPIDPPNRSAGPFALNNKIFNIDSINQVVHINTTEIWTLVNKTLIAHPFHIHDVQFNIIERSGQTPPIRDKGWKDVVLVLPNDSVKFITKFETFSDYSTPYMYHCHLLHHEDDGMMGSFLVIDSTQTERQNYINNTNELLVYPNPVSDEVKIQLVESGWDSHLRILSILGAILFEAEIPNPGFHSLDISFLHPGVYFVEVVSGQKKYAKKIIKL